MSDRKKSIQHKQQPDVKSSVESPRSLREAAEQFTKSVRRFSEYGRSFGAESCDPESYQSFAKVREYEDGELEYYVRASKIGDLLNPWSPTWSDGNGPSLDLEGNPVYYYQKVTKEVYNRYEGFLRSKSARHYESAQKEFRD